MTFFIYAGLFGVGLCFALVSALFGHAFGGHEHPGDLAPGGHDHVGTGGHTEAGFQDAGMPGLSPFSPTTIASFVTAFGGFGMILTQIETLKSPWISAPIALLGGLIVAILVFWLFNTVFRRTQSSSEAHTAQLIGCDATIITPIPDNGVGEIAYVVGGTRYSSPARTENGRGMGNGRTVKITRIVGTQFYVSVTS